MKNEVKQYQCIGGKLIAVNPYRIPPQALETRHHEYIKFQLWANDPANQYATDAHEGVYEADRFEEVVWQYQEYDYNKDTGELELTNRWDNVVNGHHLVNLKEDKQNTRQFLRLKQNQQVKETKEGETVEQELPIFNSGGWISTMVAIPKPGVQVEYYWHNSATDEERIYICTCEFDGESTSFSEVACNSGWQSQFEEFWRPINWQACRTPDAIALLEKRIAEWIEVEQQEIKIYGKATTETIVAITELKNILKELKQIKPL